MSAESWRLFLFWAACRKKRQAAADPFFLSLSRTCASASGYALGFTASVITK
jgi:hypothetical protein